MTKKKKKATAANMAIPIMTMTTAKTKTRTTRGRALWAWVQAFSPAMAAAVVGRLVLLRGRRVQTKGGNNSIQDCRCHSAPLTWS